MTTGTRVELTLAEALHAATVGTLRHYESVSAGHKHIAGFDAEKKNSFSLNVEGVFAEIAAAKALGMYFPASVNTFNAPDIGDKYQVRYSMNHDYKLLIRPKDKPDEVFIFVTGVAPTFWIRGWILGFEAKEYNEYQYAPAGRPPAWFIPVSKLQPIENIPR